MPSDLDQLAARYAGPITDAVRKEYPNSPRHTMNGPDDLAPPRQLHPAFYGCFDWHSAVEMHWALVRLLRLAPQATPPSVAEVLDEHLTPANLAVETAYFDDHRTWERPYGWGWLLTLAAELRDWSAEADDEQVARWADAVAPLATRLSHLMIDWLAKASYPTRDGAHMNSAFGLVRAWRWSAQDEPLREAISTTARGWFTDDRDYPVGYEPGGADFLSGALTEAELMHAVLPGDEFARWFATFLPDPSPLYRPAVVSDSADGYITHLHGLNLYRAHAFRVLAGQLGVRAEQAGQAHLDASLPSVVGGDWMAEHWLAAYAILALT